MKVTTDRVNPYDLVPRTMKAMVGVEMHIKSGGLEHSLIELVKMRASQINGCAFCIATHSGDARENGETEQRLYLLDAWHESSLYSPRERAALAWTDALTKVSEAHAPDAIYEDVAAQFSDEEIATLTVLIGQINSWNRIAIGLGYQHP
jgi:AhpD family alkylhydroperoxidase